MSGLAADDGELELRGAAAVQGGPLEQLDLLVAVEDELHQQGVGARADRLEVSPSRVSRASSTWRACTIWVWLRLWVTRVRRTE
ncbi:MAG: hypothetical protein R2731_10610 [Nocardioides sp.]